MFPFFVEEIQEPLNVNLFTKYHVLNSKPYKVDEAKPKKHGRRNNCPKSWRATNQLFCKHDHNKKRTNVKKHKQKNSKGRQNKQKLKTVLTHEGYYDIYYSHKRYGNGSCDHRHYGGYDHESLCLQSYTKYYNSNYSTQSQRKQLLSNLQIGMLCYYWNRLYYVCSIIKFGNRLRIALLSDCESYMRQSKQNIVVQDRYYIDDKKGDKKSLKFEYGLDILPYCPLNWNVYSSRSRARCRCQGIVIDKNNHDIMYLNINLPNLFLFPVTTSCRVYNFFKEFSHEQKLYDSIQCYFAKHNDLLSRICRDTYSYNYNDNFIKLANIWIEMKNNGKKLQLVDNKCKINLKFINNYGCCIIYNFLTQEWKIPTPKNCPNWFTYEFIFPAKLDKPLTIELTCYLNQSILDQANYKYNYGNIRVTDFGNFDNNNSGRRLEKSFCQFDDNVQKGLITKVPMPGLYYFEETENVFDLLICGYISRFINVRNCAFFNIKYLNNIISKYYGQCHQWHVRQFFYQGDLLSQSKHTFCQHEWKHEFTTYNIISKTVSGKEKNIDKNFSATKQARCGIKWIGTSNDMYNFGENVILRFGINIEIECEYECESIDPYFGYGYSHLKPHRTKKKETRFAQTFIDITCMNNDSCNYNDEMINKHSQQVYTFGYSCDPRHPKEEEEEEEDSVISKKHFILFG